MLQDELFRMGMLEEWFQCDRKTIISRVMVFSSHFSSHTQPAQPHRQRQFTRRDVQVYATIQKLEADGKDREEIELYLAGNHELEPFPSDTPSLNPEATAVVLSMQARQANADRELALAQVESVRAELRAKEQEIENLREQLHNLSLELAERMARREGELREEIGKLKFQLARYLDENKI